MIAINELKLDNWVIHYRIGNCQINGIQLHSSGDTFVYLFREGMEFQHREKITYIDPIPLTPEILGKCGFVVAHGVYIMPNNKEYEDWDEPLQKTDNRFAFEYVSDNFHLVNGSGLIEYIIGKPIPSLHQLQNLYFALTGTELNVTL